RQQKAALVVAHLAQAASMDCSARLDCGFLLPCGLHEKIMNTFLASDAPPNRLEVLRGLAPRARRTSPP
ncbi:MAG TPA: hypothetical protein PLJ81_13875, partial [Giesbergeria sp.]|nr:hypothetical protein [Giesbergeria sp.]